MMAIFKWEPNKERYKQKYGKLNVYDWRHPDVFVYTIPPPNVRTREIYVCDDQPSKPQVSQVSTGDDLPNPEFTYFKDFRKMYKMLLINHGFLMKKLLSAKKKLAKTKEYYRQFIKVTLFPFGFPEDIQTTTKVNRVSVGHKRPKPALAPGFVLDIADAEKVGNVTKTITGIQTPTRIDDLTDSEHPVTMGGTEPEIANVAPAKTVVLSPPVSPKQTKVSRRIMRTPQKKGKGKRARGNPRSTRLLKRLCER